MSEGETHVGGFEKLWAPWRMKYIAGIDPGKEDACVFCEAPRTEDDAGRCIVFRGKTSYGILNIFPYNNGHLLVVPYVHAGELSVLDAETRLELFDTADMVTEVMKKTMRPDGFNLGMNLGRSAGAGIADHLHLHLVPRWNGDTNFLPVIAGTKVISESLEETYEKLSRGIREFFESDDPCREALRKRLTINSTED